jgi:hypothetical protein
MLLYGAAKQAVVRSNRTGRAAPAGRRPENRPQAIRANRAGHHATDRPQGCGLLARTGHCVKYWAAPPRQAQAALMDAGASIRWWPQRAGNSPDRYPLWHSASVGTWSARCLRSVTQRATSSRRLPSSRRRVTVSCRRAGSKESVYAPPIFLPLLRIDIRDHWRSSIDTESL